MTSNKPRRIVFVSYNYWPPDFGGELLLSIERLHALAERGFDITVLTSGRPGFSDHQIDRKVAIHRSRLVGTSRLARLLRRIVFIVWAGWRLFRSPMDVVHVGDLPGIDFATSTIVLWVWARIARRHRAYTMIANSLADSPTEYFKTKGWQGWWRSNLFRVVDKVVSNSPALQQSVESVLPNKSELIVNGVREDYICRVTEDERQRLRTEAGITDKDAVVFVFVGSVGRRKGFDTLAEAFSELVVDHPGWHLWVVGPYTTVQSQNINLQEVADVTRPLARLEARVTFWGRIDDRMHLRDLIAAADVFVFPSRLEGLGVAPLEAMATGRPLIISRIPGVTDLANIDGQTGLFIQPGDTQGLKHAMLKLGELPELRRQMGAAARQRIIEAFSWEAYLKKWEILYSRNSD